MTTYREFLDAHRSRANRVGHLISLVAGIVAAPVAVSLWGWPWFLVAFPIIGVGGGLSHHFFESNSPLFLQVAAENVLLGAIEVPLLLAYDVCMGIETLLDSIAWFWFMVIVFGVSWLTIFNVSVPPIHRGDCYDMQIRPDGVLVQTMHDDCVCKDCICAPDDCRCLWERIDPSELPDELRLEIEHDQKQLMEAIADKLQEK